MPTYNRAEYILETIESILGQTYQNWELFIIDDGSEDHTKELVSGIKDERIKFYEAGKIGIGIKIKNIGIEMSTGDLIAFIDSDDLWAPQKLEKQVQALQQYPNAAFSLTGGYNFQKLNEPLEYFYRQREGLKYGHILHSFFNSEVSILPQTLMFSKRCMEVISHFVKTAPHSDVEFIIGLAVHFKAVVLYEPLLFRRLHPANFSSLHWERGYTEKIAIIHAYQKQKLIPSVLAHDSLFKLYINFGEKYLRFNKKMKAVRKFLKAWTYKPFSIVPIKKIGKAILLLLK